MHSYKKEISSIENVLNRFVSSGKIDTEKLGKLDNAIKWSDEDQIRVLNNSYLSLFEQRLFFGAIRNMNTSLKRMKERLAEASRLKENPTTAELALELMPSFLNLVPYVDNLINNNRYPRENEIIIKFSRLLYKKATMLGFSQDVASQLKDAQVEDSQIESFIDRFSKNVALELDIEEEVSATENSH